MQVVAAHPLNGGNGLALLDSMETAIHTVMWLKRKLNPFDVTNVSITAFAHKLSMEIIEKGVILRRKCLGMTYWILLLPEYQYTVCILEHLQNYMIFHRAERLKLQHSIRVKVRYLSSSLHFTAEAQGRKKKLSLFLRDDGLSADTVRVQRRFRVGRLQRETVRQKGNNDWWAHVWCMMVPGLVWQHMVQFAWFLYLLFDSLVLRLETVFSQPDHTCCRLVFISDFSFLYTAHTLACLNLWKTPFGGSEDVRWGEKSWRIWGFYWLKRCPAVSQTGPLWQVCLLSCRRWFPEFLLVISAANTVRTRVTQGPEAHR